MYLSVGYFFVMILTDVCVSVCVYVCVCVCVCIYIAKIQNIEYEIQNIDI